MNFKIGLEVFKLQMHENDTILSNKTYKNAFNYEMELQKNTTFVVPYFQW